MFMWEDCNVIEKTPKGIAFVSYFKQGTWEGCNALREEYAWEGALIGIQMQGEYTLEHKTLEETFKYAKNDLKNLHDLLNLKTKRTKQKVVQTLQKLMSEPNMNVQLVHFGEMGQGDNKIQYLEIEAQQCLLYVEKKREGIRVESIQLLQLNTGFLAVKSLLTEEQEQRMINAAVQPHPKLRLKWILE